MRISTVVSAFALALASSLYVSAAFNPTQPLQSPRFTWLDDCVSTTRPSGVTLTAGSGAAAYNSTLNGFALGTSGNNSTYKTPTFRLNNQLTFTVVTENTTITNTVKVGMYDASQANHLIAWVGYTASTLKLVESDNATAAASHTMTSWYTAKGMYRYSISVSQDKIVTGGIMNEGCCGADNTNNSGSKSIFTAYTETTTISPGDLVYLQIDSSDASILYRVECEDGQSSWSSGTQSH